MMYMSAQNSSVKCSPQTSDSVGHEISMSDFTSEMLPSEPLRSILPLMVDETNIQLNMSLLRLSSTLLMLFSPRREDENYLELYIVLPCSGYSFQISGLGLNFLIMSRKSDLSVSKERICGSEPSLFMIFYLGWGVMNILGSSFSLERVTLMYLWCFFAKREEEMVVSSFQGQQYGNKSDGGVAQGLPCGFVFFLRIFMLQIYYFYCSGVLLSFFSSSLFSLIIALSTISNNTAFNKLTKL